MALRSIIKLEEIDLLLSNIEEYIDQTILNRGLQYYESGLVEALDEIVPGQYEATVTGTEDYFVEVTLKENKIMESYCSCPYDYSHICKHQVAVFFYIREKAPIEQKMKQSLPKMLNELKKNELIDIIVNITNKNTDVEKQLLYSLAKPSDEIEEAKKLIKEYIKKARVREFIHYDKTDLALTGAHHVLNKANDKINKQEFELSITMSILVLSNIVDIILYCDDSAGTVGQVIHEAIFTVKDAIQEGADSLSESEQKNILELILKEAQNKRYQEVNDEWSYDLIQACIPLSRNFDNRKLIESVLLKLLRPLTENNWNYDYIKSIQLEIIEQNDRYEDAEKFIFDNIKISGFREKAITNYFQQGYYEKVAELCLEGEKSDKTKPGLIIKWKNHRYAAYEKMGENIRQRELAIELLLQGEYRYFEIIKRLTPPEQWGNLFQEILAGLKNSRIYVDVLIDENQTGLLLDYCMQNPYDIVKLHPYLTKEHFHEVSSLFREYINIMASNVSDRRGYKRVCKEIKEYKKACGMESVKELKNELKVKYKQRPAFIDELNKIK
jgi:SWIM zinc finger